MSNNAPIAVVTGASRGAGRGIAHALGSHGCTVYVTGRSEKAGDAPLPGTIHATVEQVNAAGGTGIPVRVDHTDLEQIEALFARVKKEQGRLDILVNNAFAPHDQMTIPGPFWEKPLDMVGMWDAGLIGAYAACYHAAPMMVAQKRGLIIFTSASGSTHFAMGPVYGVHKAGLDKMAGDMGVEFRDHNVAAISIWMGMVLTERIAVMREETPEMFDHALPLMETPEFTGHVIWALYNDPELMKKSGQTLIGAELAKEYGIKDEDGREPASYRDTHGVAPFVQYNRRIG